MFLGHRTITVGINTELDKVKSILKIQHVFLTSGERTQLTHSCSGPEQYSTECACQHYHIFKVMSMLVQKLV